MPCERCHDTTWVIETVDGVDHVRRCECWRTALVDRQLEHARIPRRYQHCELDNFEQNYDSLREAHRRARAFVEAFPVVDRGLLLRGRHGVGKTHLAVAILKTVIREKGARGFFYETRELLKLVRDSYASGGEITEMEVLRPVLDADLLVLDDLGAEKTSEWVQETLGLVVNARYGERRPTIFTSNLVHGTDLDDLNSLRVQLGERTRSRLLEMCHDVEMDAPDVREYGLHPTPEAAARSLRDSTAGAERRGRSGFPDRSKGMARAALKPRGQADVAWSGGKGGSA
ncbi:MAG: ATP-binding protein [Vicinamibacterales bacterium]